MIRDALHAEVKNLKTLCLKQEHLVKKNKLVFPLNQVHFPDPIGKIFSSSCFKYKLTNFNAFYVILLLQLIHIDLRCLDI